MTVAVVVAVWPHIWACFPRPLLLIGTVPASHLAFLADVAGGSLGLV